MYQFARIFISSFTESVFLHIFWVSVKTTVIWRITIQETSGFLNHGDPIQAPVKVLGTLHHYRIEGFEVGPLMAPPLSQKRDVSLSSSECNFFPDWMNYKLSYDWSKPIFLWSDDQEPLSTYYGLNWESPSQQIPYWWDIGFFLSDLPLRSHDAEREKPVVRCCINSKRVL